MGNGAPPIETCRAEVEKLEEGAGDRLAGLLKGKDYSVLGVHL